MARRRYQKGSLFLRGKREKVWVGRWLEDEIHPDNSVHRRHRSEVLGTTKDYPTKRLAHRALEQRLAEVNSVTYCPKHTITFGEFVERWKQSVLPQHKPSSQSSERAHLNHLLPCLAGTPMSAISVELIQKWVSQQKCAPKTVRNYIATIRILRSTAKSWGYVTHNPFDGLRLPKRGLVSKPRFTTQQGRDIISMAAEPYKTMFWIVAETGMRGGEVCGLGVSDVDLEKFIVKVWRSAWRGKLQTPKTNNAVRHFPISPNLAAHIRQYLGSEWNSNPDNLLFCTRSGRPLDNYNVVTWQLKPLLERVGVTDTRRMGLHAFRHCNATELDRMGAPIKVRQDRLGHADAETTFGYTHADSGDHRKVAAELGRIFDPNPVVVEAVENQHENAGIPCPSLPKLPLSDRNVREVNSDFVGA
jgi:integrase